MAVCVFVTVCGGGIGVGAPLAFPGAEGYGRFASGGRGGAVYEVVNLNDKGDGSLRAAVEASGPRTVVFRISGTIYLETDLRIRNGDLTVAGQTAPGDGICIARRGFRIEADNVIVRFIRARLGDLYPRESGLASYESDALECRFTDNVIVDHCSFSWSIDECATAYNNTRFTMQWCMVTESLNNSYHSKGAHGYGGVWGGKSASFHHNLLAHHMSRNPRFNGARYDDPETWDHDVDHRNNVIYNWGGNSCYGGEPNAGGHQAHYNLVGNYYQYGPATQGSKRGRIVEVSNLNGKVSRFYVSGNYVWDRSATTGDNWLGVDNVPVGQEAEVRSDEVFAMAPITEQAALVAYELVLGSAGASFPRRDAVDTRIVNEVRTGTATYGKNGIIDSQTEVGGYPELKSVPAPVDTDRDGMPDDWELERGLDPSDASDGRVVAPGNEYTNLELYLNGLVDHLYPAPEVRASAGVDGLRLEWSNQWNDSSLLQSVDAVEWELREGVGSEGARTVVLEAVDDALFFKVEGR